MAATGVSAESGKRQGPGEAGAVLAARELCCRFGGFVAVNNVNLDVHHARVHALIGPNGAGKTTVFNLLTKFLQPTGGRITLLGRDITRLSPARVAQMGLARSFQISAIFPHLSVLENIRIALQRPSRLAMQFWLPLARLDALNERALALLRSVGLARECHRQAADLSYGQKRVLEIATTLALDPKVLLLDEPMAGMGREDIARVAELIRALAKTRAVLMVEHNLKVVADLCDQVTVLQRGEILAAGDYAAVSNDERVRAAYLGADHE